MTCEMKLISVVLFICFAAITSSKEVVVKTKLGPVKGQTINVLSQTVNVFKSIRYGKAPTGELRFKKPEQYKWSGTFDATKDGPVCWQPAEFGAPTKDMNEDCLLMNIWSKKLDKKAKLPVMFWIHGGGFFSGGANSGFGTFYNGSVLALHDVVVVAINYRLHNLGFLFANSSEAPGNAGLYDQVLAMKWVRDNIEEFGGDFRKVTIFGESAGSMSVGFHLVSPLSRNLFHRAIMQSGSPYYYGKETNKTHILGKTKELAKTMNCNNTESMTQIMECLRKVDPMKMTASNQVFPEPLIGDEFNPIASRRAMKSGNFNPTKDLLAGVTDDEGSGFIKYAFKNQTLDKTFVKAMVGGIARDFFKKKVDPEKLINHYFGHLTNEQWFDQNILKQLVSRVLSDNLMDCPTYFQAADYAKHSINHNAMFYIQSYKSKWFSDYLDCNETWQGVCHGQDLFFTFGAPLTIPGIWTQDDKVMSLLMMYYWTNFAKNGNPYSSKPPATLKSVKNLEIWPNISWFKYQPKLGMRPLVMKLHPEKVSYFSDPWKKNCDDFWSSNMD